MTEQTPPRVILVGSGRLARALADRWTDPAINRGWVRLVAVVGRDLAKARSIVAGLATDVPEATLEGVGAGTGWPEAEFVVLAVDDRAIPSVVDRLAPLATKDQVWCHTAGGVGPEVLKPVQAKGARIGVFHPARPVPAADRSGMVSLSWVADMDGRALIHDDSAHAGRSEDDPGGAEFLGTLALASGLTPVYSSEVPDPALYHAGCALAANGTTALAVAAGEAIRAGAGLSDEDTAEVIASLLTGAAAAIRAHPKGWRSGAALSGPAVRGDLQAMHRHLHALKGMGSDFRGAALQGYRATMAIAAELSHTRGALDADALARIRAELLGEG